MSERFLVGSAPWASEPGVSVVPGGVGCQVDFGGGHLVVPPCKKLRTAHRRVRGQAVGVGVVWGGGEGGRPVFEQHVPGPGTQELVGTCHEWDGGMLLPAVRGACRTRGNRVKPSCRGRVRWARASSSRYFLMRGEGTAVRQSSGR